MVRQKREQEAQAARGQVMKAWAGEADRPGFKSQPKCSPALSLSSLLCLNTGVPGPQVKVVHQGVVSSQQMGICDCRGPNRKQKAPSTGASSREPSLLGGRERGHGVSRQEQGPLVKNGYRGFPGGIGLIPDPGRFHVPRSSSACVPQLSLCSGAQELQLLKPMHPPRE